MTVIINTIVAKALLKTGKFVGVTFRKKNGQVRKLTGRAGVAKFVKGKDENEPKRKRNPHAFNPEDKGMVVLWESTQSMRKNGNDKGYRYVTLNRLMEVRARGEVFKVV